MPSPQQTISVRVSHDLHQQLKVIAAARRQTPSELVRGLVEKEIASLGPGAHREARSENKAPSDTSVIGRLAHAALFAELSLEQFTASEDPNLTQQLHRQASAKVAELLGAGARAPEQERPPFRDEQLEIAKKFANG